MQTGKTSTSHKTHPINHIGTILYVLKFLALSFVISYRLISVSKNPSFLMYFEIKINMNVDWMFSELTPNEEFEEIYKLIFEHLNPPE